MTRPTTVFRLSENSLSLCEPTAQVSWQFLTNFFRSTFFSGSPEVTRKKTAVSSPRRLPVVLSSAVIVRRSSPNA